MRQLKWFFSNKEIENVLDVGTGSGNFLPVLKDTFPTAKITGVDPNNESLISAAQKFHDVSFKRMSAEQLDFPNHSFNVVSISMALHHLTDVDLALNEMKRVVKPGGWIIINELFSDNLNEAQQVHRMVHHFGSRIDRIQGINHNQAFKKHEILQFVNEAGIEIQFHFEHKKEENKKLTSVEIEEKVAKMRKRLDTVKTHPDYEFLKSQINEFRERVVVYGYQSATRIVIVGQVL